MQCAFGTKADKLQLLVAGVGFGFDKSNRITKFYGNVFSYSILEILFKTNLHRPCLLALYI